MKKEYKDLELETVRFDAEDIIAASVACDADSGLTCECDMIEVCGCDGGVCKCVNVMMKSPKR